jgi:hypothetical protein
VTGLERRCRWLLLAYPAWYRRRRGEEMLGTLLEASPPGRRWPSFRDARSLIIRGSRVRGWVWLLSMLWVAAGVANTGYLFYATTEPWAGDIRGFGISGWSGGNNEALQIVIILDNGLILVPFLLVVVGFIWLRGWRPRNGLRAVAWVGAWIAGVALLALADAWGQYPQNGCPQLPPTSPQCHLPQPAVVSWGELAICAAWLVLGGLMAWILAVPARHSDIPRPASLALGD